MVDGNVAKMRSAVHLWHSNSMQQSSQSRSNMSSALQGLMVILKKNETFKLTETVRRFVINHKVSSITAKLYGKLG